jgi:hypothetical protein
MYGAHEGDLVRPLGFVTLYSAYAEGELDELIEALPAEEIYDEAKRRWTVGQKVNYARELVKRLRSPELKELAEALKAANDLFARRNELVHGRLFAGGRLVSNRAGKPEQRISQEDISRLADDLFNWKERLWVCRFRQLLPLLASGRPSDDA